MASPIVELESLEKTLGFRTRSKLAQSKSDSSVPVLQTNNGPGLVGLTTIASHLVKVAKKEALLGSTAEESAIVQQWLEYRITRIDSCNSQEDRRIVLKELDCYLEDKVYLAGNSLTLADIMVYNGLHPVMAELNHEERERCVNVSRWFNHIQHCPGVRQHSAAIVFMRNRLYPTIH
ncbi:eukaryotic translation elongation factor 1 epsilon-1 [Hemiscyllium ocellatum]|uniref:eukaryotic translation elongation factor 1 epsilon-1 n=1 Tax=Hemiscyllium ocellatum TaxID=170820 RepID=UPI0029675ECA|nr:eukaryotic translation elongation factor 1 epsilon-1 [Hemiscyllium ocellatum]